MGGGGRGGGWEGTWCAGGAAVADRANRSDVAAITLLTGRALISGGALGALRANGSRKAPGLGGLGVDDEADLFVEELLGLGYKVARPAGLGLDGAGEVVEDVDDALRIDAVGVHELGELRFARLRRPREKGC